MNPILQDVLSQRYFVKNENGEPAEDLNGMFHRVAEFVASAKKRSTDEKIRASEAYFEVMAEGLFCPNSPVLMNFGKPNSTGQGAACFALKPKTDSMAGIFDMIKDIALIQQSGGGTGINWSVLRPKGAPVRSSGGISSGVLSFAYVANACMETVEQAGARRGAGLFLLEVWHPDIIEFIMAKGELNKNNYQVYTQFEKSGSEPPELLKALLLETQHVCANFSVGVSDSFMRAVENDEGWELVFPDTSCPDYNDTWDGDIEKWIGSGKPYKVYGTIRAKDLFREIAQRAWQNGEPGLLFMDTIARANPDKHLGRLDGINPCVTGDTWIATSEGPRQVREIVGRQVELVVNGKAYKTDQRGFFKTGRKPVVKLRTQEGYTVRLTPDHKILRNTHGNHYEWTPAAELKVGDNIVLHNHRSLNDWPGVLTEGEGYLLGLLVGDGTITKRKAVLSIWTKENDVAKNKINSVMHRVLEYAKGMRHRSDFKGWIPINGRNEYRLTLSGLKNLAQKMGMFSGKKTVTPEIEHASMDGYRGFLRGLFDADGTIIGNQKKGISIRLAQSDLELLRSVQRMLLRLGIVSTIYETRRKPGYRFLPDGKGGQKKYYCKEQHELAISKDNLLIFAKQIGFSDNKKSNKLKSALEAYKRNINRECFKATVLSIEEDGTEDVYDVKVPEINAFDANGIYVHNCGEQILFPDEACVLGSINLGKFVAGNGVDYERLGRVVDVAVSFLDDVIDVNRYPTEKIEKKVAQTRKIGLGVCGFADLCVKMGVVYGSEESVELARNVMSFIQRKARAASAALAEKYGAYPANKDREVRNSTVTTIAPTGTISMIMEASSGIEPYFAMGYRRLVNDMEYTVVNPLFKGMLSERGLWNKEIENYVLTHQSIQGCELIPESIRSLFVTASDVTPEQHIRVQAAFQEFTDNAVSKTINLHNKATVEDVERAFVLAWKSGLKGITVYRDGSRQKQVISSGSKRRTAKKIRPEPRPVETFGRTRKVDTGCGKMYVTTNFHPETKELVEVFLTTGSGGGCTIMTEAVSRLVSLCIRAGVAVEDIVDQLCSTHTCPAFSRSWHQLTGRSCPDVVGKVLKSVSLYNVESQPGTGVIEILSDKIKCPKCGSAMIPQSGCFECPVCTYSKCS